MNKQAFLSLLRERLVKFEVDEENINKYIKQFERYFNTMTDDEINDQIVNYDGVEGIALNIIKLIKKKNETSQTISSVTKEINLAYPEIQLKIDGNADTDTSEKIVNLDNSLENNTATDVIKLSDKNNINNEQDNGSGPADENISVNYDEDLQPEDDYNFLKKKNRGFSPAMLSDNLQTTDKSKKIISTNLTSKRIMTSQDNKTVTQNKSVSDRTEHIQVQKPTQLSQIKQPEQDKTYLEHRPSGRNRNINRITVDNHPVLQSNKETSPDINIDELDESFYEDTAIPNTALFWIVILLTMPLSVPLFLTVLFLFFAAFSILAVSIVLLIAGLILIIVAGTGLSLVGIIYGVTQIFKSLPIGLFEIGFGVIIGGSAMLIGILIYNTAIRFLPFVIKYLIVFFMFTMHKIKDLLKFIKRECAKQ